MINFKTVNFYFDEAINRIKLLMEENLDPIIKSFEQWENIIAKFESDLKLNENYDIINDIEKPIYDKNFEDSDLCKQYINIKLICNKIINKINENKNFFENFKTKLKNGKYEVFTY